MVQGLKVSVHITIDAISCPGALLAENVGDCHLKVRLFNTRYRSNDFYPFFPIIIRSEFKSQRLLPNIIAPDALADQLDNELAVVELCHGEKVIAYCHSTARKFLFPNIPCKTYCASQRELLLTKAPIGFGDQSTLQPKLEFATQVTIEETAIRPRLNGRLVQCQVLLKIDDRVRSKNFGKLEKTENRPNAAIIEHSKTYNELHERIKSAIKTNNEKHFEMPVNQRAARTEERAPIVYLSDTADWSKFSAVYQGSDYRTTMDASMDEIYAQMLTNHEKNLFKK